MYSYWLFQLAFDSYKSKKEYIHSHQFFTEKTEDNAKLNLGRAGRVHSDLDATRRLEELKSEFAESPPIRISQSPVTFVVTYKILNEFKYVLKFLVRHFFCHRHFKLCGVSENKL